MNWLTASSRMDAKSQPGPRDKHSSLASDHESRALVTRKHRPFGPKLSGSRQLVAGSGAPASGAGAPASLRSSSIFRPVVSFVLSAGDGRGATSGSPSDSRGVGASTGPGV